MTEFKMPAMDEADPEAYAKATGWPEIKKPAPIEAALPPFPAHLLPAALATMVEQTAAEIQAPVDIAGMLALPVAAANLAGKLLFEGRSGHREHPMLWTMCAAASSERKTPVFNRLRKPLDEAAELYAEAFYIDNEVRLAELDMVETGLKELKDQFSAQAKLQGTTEISDSARGDLKTLLAKKLELEKPIYKPCVWATSPTPEGLHMVMADNGGRVAIFSDEGGLIGTLAGRYSSKDGADMDPFLSGFVGGPLKAPRASGGRKDVPAAYVTIGLAVQPTVLDELGAVKGASERGLLGRFLFAISSSLVGTRMYGNSTPVEDEVARRYAQVLAQWAAWPGKPDGPVVIGLTKQAYAAYEKFHDATEVRCAEGGDLHGAPILSKISGTTLRIAGLFHCYDHGRNSAMGLQIGEDAMLRAIELTEQFFIPHGLAVAARFVTACVDGAERRILDWIRREPNERKLFTLRSLYQGVKGSSGGATIQKTSDLEEPIKGLIEDGYLREAERVSEDGKKTKSVWFEVNPAVFQ